MTHPDPAEEHLAAIQLRYEEAKASIFGLGGDEPLPETEAIDLRRLPSVPRRVGDDEARPVAVFHDNVVAIVPGRRRWWRRRRLHDGGDGRC